MVIVVDALPAVHADYRRTTCGVRAEMLDGMVSLGGYVPAICGGTGGVVLMAPSHGWRT